MVALLVELQIEAHMVGSRDGVQRRGRTIGPQERHERIAAVIGDEKLDELLLLEVNRGAYWETQQIASLLRRQRRPSHRRAARWSVRDTRGGSRPVSGNLPPDELDPRSVEHLEHSLTQLDEFDRHVVEAGTERAVADAGRASVRRVPDACPVSAPTIWSSAKETEGRQSGRRPAVGLPGAVGQLPLTALPGHDGSGRSVASDGARSVSTTTNAITSAPTDAQPRHREARGRKPRRR